MIISPGIKALLHEDLSTKLGPLLEYRMGRGKAPQACLIIASLHISLLKLD